MRNCVTCKQDKKETEYYKLGGYLMIHCKLCTNAKVDKKKVRAYRKRYYQNNRQRILAKSKDYASANKDKTVKRNALYEDYWSKQKGTHHFKWMARIYNTHSKTKIKAIQLWSMAKKQKLSCALTGDKLTLENISIDHINPRSKGGSNELGNLQLVTRQANAIKHSLTMNELTETCKKILKHLQGFL